jgi:hypothetical protein
MKYLLLATLSLIAFNSFAQAPKLACYDSNNNLVAKQSETSVSFNDMKTDRYSVEVNYNSSKGTIQYVIYEMNSGLDMDSGEVEIAKGDKVQFISGYYCSIN